MMQCLSPCFVRFAIAVAAAVLLCPVLGSSAEIALDQHERSLDVVADRLARAVSADPLLPLLQNPELSDTDTQESLPTIDLLDTLATAPSSFDPDLPITEDPAPFPGAFALDLDDFPWPFAVPYAPQAQPPILSPSFNPDAEGTLPSKKDIMNRYASNNSPESGVIETGQLVTDVWTYDFYDTGLVRVNDAFLNPLTDISGYLPDGTRVGLDSDGVSIGWDKRVPYGPEMQDVMKAFWLPGPQWFG